MPLSWIYTLLSVIFISLISLVGIFALSLKTQRLAQILTYLVSFSAGALLGDVFIHLLPEIAEEGGFNQTISLLILLGIIVTFVIEKVIHWQHHQSDQTKAKPHPVTTITLFGDAVHNFIDGLIVAGSYLVNPTLGITTTIAVILHEIPQEVGNFGVLVHGGYSAKKALWYNFLSALTAILGAIIALIVGTQIETFATQLAAFTAGTFIYIAGSDLIPEMHKEVSAKKSVIQFVWLLLGIIIMLSLLTLE